MLPFNIGVGGASGVDVGDIGHSLRLRSAAVAYLSRTPASAGNRRTWTWSGWIKLGALGANQVIFNQGGVSTNYTLARLNANNQLDFHSYGGASYNFQKVTSAVFRDPTAFIHVMFVLDATNTQARIYVNGAEAAYTTNTNPSNTDQPFNQAALHYIGAATSPAQYLDGYLSRIAFVDGTALTPSSFGYFNTTINEWVSKSQSAVKAVVDAGGTNSFMLEFDDATSLTTLGYDKSSKGNNWTLNNVSLTAGTTYDYMLDVPGNSYCTINPLMYRASTGQAIYSYANLRATNDSGVAGKYIWGTQYVSSGKYYWETLVEVVGSSINGIGVDSGLAQNTVFNDSVIYFSNGHKYVNNVDTAYGATYTTGDVIGTLLDKTANTVEFFKNGTSQGVINLVSTSVALGMHSEMGGSNGIHVLNFGQRTFSYPSNQGTAKALCQENLPTPAILNPELHFDVKLDTGANIKSTMDALFSGNVFEWIKDRANANNHQLADVNRGLTAILQSNTTAAETTYSTPSGSSVGLGWKADGAAVTNNAGSISSQVSANVLAGFSVVTYTGTGANATVGHGLASAPELVIVKGRDFSGYSWTVYNKSLTSGYVLFMETTDAQTSRPTSFNSTAPTSSVFSLGTDLGTNQNTKHYVAYCAHSVPGHSKVGSYTGNGSADGPFVPLGFKPKFVMVKRSDSTGSWQMFDSLRAGYNVDNDQLVANTSATEVTTDLLDLTSSSFKVRSTSIEVNASGGTYIFIAFADVPGKYSLAR